VFFDRSRVKYTKTVALATLDGVGAIPLRPADADPAVHLDAVLRALLICNRCG
jgi:hypothetical protein